MPKVDFSGVSDMADYAPIPEGDYVCQLVDIEMDRTRAGDEMWKLRWKVESGEFAGRLLFDKLIFSPKALPRAKYICECCGIDVKGAVDLDPSMLLDKRAELMTYQEEYEDDKGQKKVRNAIGYDGYAYAPTGNQPAPF